MKSRLASLLALLASSACADPTEVVLFVDTQLGVPCQVDKLIITVEGQGAPIVREADPRAGLQSLTILADGGGAAFTVRVDATKAGATVASATANAVFVEGVRRALPVVLDDGCRSTPCDRSGAAGDFAQPTPATRASCAGVSNRYRVSESTLIGGDDACTFLAASVPTDVLGPITNEEVQVDEAGLVQAIDDRFEFLFFGQKIQKVWVSGDGYVTFGPDAPRALNSQVRNDHIAASGAPKFGVSAFWESLDFKPTGRVCVGLQSAGDVDTLWITWKDACFRTAGACNAGDDLTFSVGLEEGSNRVIVAYLEMRSGEDARARGATAVAGIASPGGPRCAITDCDVDEGLCTDGTTPCGYSQAFARQAQTMTWPTTYVFEPVPDL